MIALNIHCPDGPLQFRTACCRQDELPRAGFTQALGIQKPNEKQHRISRSGADRRGDRIGSKAAEAELDPRCTSITDRSRKSHSPEPGAWPLARGGPGDQTFPSSMMRATCDSLSVIPCEVFGHRSAQTHRFGRKSNFLRQSPSNIRSES